ncbi:hypothetical protein, partial [Pseudophaeobacter sp.]|uniref:hypothetical protein n=1 Tax=Pseudophaeobacter sp. TaxID=1971739 RepID=UPI00329867FD
ASLGDQTVEPDGIAVVDVGPADLPSPPPAAEEPSPAEEPVVQAEPVAPPTTEQPALPKAPAPLEHAPQDGDADTEEASLDDGPVAGFSTRRRRSSAEPDASPASAPTPTRSQPAAPVPPKAPAPTAATARPSKTAPAVAPAPQEAKPVAAATAPPAATVSPVATQGTPSAPVKTPGPVPGPLGVPAAKGTGASPVAAPAPKTPVAKPAKPAASPEKTGKAAVDPSLAAEAVKVGGKPRHLGFILTAVLLLVMAAVAAFALFSEGGLFFSGERPPLEGSLDEPPTETTARPQPSENQEAIEQQPAADNGSDLEIPSDIPLSQIDPEPDRIAPQVSALPGQPDPGVVELSALEQPGEEAAPTADTEHHASTGQPVLDALEEPAVDSEALHDEEITEALSAAALYAATGIWQQVPQIAEAPALVQLDDIYVASIDNSDLSQDAVALPTAPVLSSDPVPEAPSSPAAAGSDFDLDSRGLVVATPEGTLNPDGVMIYLGRPAVVPPPTPTRADPEALAAEAENARLASLSLIRPRPRPSDLVEQAERALLGGLSRAELARVRPRARPASLKTEEQENQPVSDLAIATSTSPRARPANFANLVDRATRQRASAPATTAAAAAVVPRSVTPSIPSSASVARQATVNNAINLRRLNLIGVFGKPSNRQALIRLPSGRTRKVQVGDRLDGGTVVAISDSQLQYQKRGTNTTLRLPGN